MTVLSVNHVTTYRYKRPVSFGEHRVMFRPRDSYDQKLLDAALAVTPAPSDLRWLHDVSGNCVAIVEFDGRKAEELRFESHIRLDHSPDNVPDFRIEDYARTYPFSYRAEEMPELVPAIERQYSDPDQAVYRWVRKFLHNGRATDTAKLLMTLTAAIKEGFAYERRYEPGTRDPALTLKLGRGSCRDLALLMIEAVRSLDLAARFVSGYLYVADHDGAQNVGGGSNSRLVPSLSAGRRMGRVRSDQRHRRKPRPDPRRGRARPSASRPAVGDLARRESRLCRDDGGRAGPVGSRACNNREEAQGARTMKV